MAEVFLNNFSCMLSCYCETYLYLKKKNKNKPEVLYLKQNTETTEDDTLMGTDVCFNVIYRLKGV